MTKESFLWIFMNLHATPLGLDRCRDIFILETKLVDHVARFLLSPLFSQAFNLSADVFTDAESNLIECQ